MPPDDDSLIAHQQQLATSTRAAMDFRPDHIDHRRALGVLFPEFLSSHASGGGAIREAWAVDKIGFVVTRRVGDHSPFNVSQGTDHRNVLHVGRHVLSGPVSGSLRWERW